MDALADAVEFAVRAGVVERFRDTQDQVNVFDDIALFAIVSLVTFPQSDVSLVTRVIVELPITHKMK